MAPSYTRQRRTMTDEQVVSLYLELKDSQATGFEAHCSPETVRKLVRAAGHPILPRGGLPDRNALLIDAAEICRRYRAGQSATVIAQAAGTYPGKVYRILRANAVPVRDGARVAAAAAKAKREKARGA
jgi:hypothetical protein